MELQRIEKEYKQYKEAFQEYSRMLEGEMLEGDIENRNRILEVRLGVTIDMLKWSDFIKQDERTACYWAYTKLVDAWFTYEAFLAMADATGFTSKSESKPEKLLKSKIPNEKIADILDDSRNSLGKLLTIERYRNNLTNYISVLLGYIGTSKSQSRLLENLRCNFANNTFEKISSADILALAYGIRNAYAHNGETARSGMAHYKLKRQLLDLIHYFTLMFVLRVTTIIIIELTREIS